jgi:hypothetical protein
LFDLCQNISSLSTKKQGKKMKLKKFLAHTKVSIAKFAEGCKINPNTMFTYVNETSEPTVTNAIKIIEATHGAVTLKDLQTKGEKK